jgi:hypothetical protein
MLAEKNSIYKALCVVLWVRYQVVVKLQHA